MPETMRIIVCPFCDDWSVARSADRIQEAEILYQKHLRAHWLESEKDTKQERKTTATTSSKEFGYADEEAAHLARRVFIEGGSQVTLIAFDPSRNLYTFDVLNLKRVRANGTRREK